MTDNEINIAIAEACGWTVELSHLQSGIDAIRDGKRKPLPDYINDLNAMHDAEKVLDTLQQGFFWDYLKDMTGEGFEQLHATARQRAEAFLRTLGRWKE